MKENCIVNFFRTDLHREVISMEQRIQCAKTMKELGG